MADILYLHGVGNPEKEPDWQDAQTRLVHQAVEHLGIRPSVFSFAYDDLFRDAEFNPAIVFRGGRQLLDSLMEFGLEDFLGVSRDRGGWSPTFRWTVGMIAQWAALADLRAELQERLRTAIEEHDPKVIIGHSLGSLISYDTFSETKHRSLLDGRLYITYGSQIGHPAVRAAFGGRIVTLQGTWVNLFNRQDRVFTKSLHPAGDGDFLQLATEFDSPSPFNHEAEFYLGHESTRSTLLPMLQKMIDSEEQPGPAAIRTFARNAIGVDALKHGGSQLFSPVAETVRETRKPRTRAVLVGIDQYQGGISNLKGCVNDQFELSATLQECGFAPQDIRALFNQHATSRGIIERLRWLFDEAMPGDTLFFAFSGHGAQITPRGHDGMPEAHMECLIPYDCDWTPPTMLSDSSLVQLYADLPYGVNFVMLLDCCHSGGVWRSVGAQVRGVPPPDDLRHESLQWDKREQMWVPRKPVAIDPQNSKFARSKKLQHAMVGEEGNVYRLGRAYAARGKRAAFEQTRSSKGHDGPFIPVVFQACRADQLASEYLHGSITYGVFTYAFTRTLREILAEKPSTSIDAMVGRIKTQLKRLNYAQDPEIAGPKTLLEQRVTDFFQFGDSRSISKKDTPE